MMRIWKLAGLTLCVAVIGSANGYPLQLPADSVDAVRILKFEVDGKKVDGRFKLLLYIGKDVITAKVQGKRILLPSRVKEQANVGVRFICRKYDLFFDQVAVSSFKVDWIIGVDHRPFKHEYVEPEAVDQLRLLYYISFVPKDGDGTRLVVKVFK